MSIDREDYDTGRNHNPFHSSHGAPRRSTPAEDFGDFTPVGPVGPIDLFGVADYTIPDTDVSPHQRTWVERTPDFDWPSKGSVTIWHQTNPTQASVFTLSRENAALLAMQINTHLMRSN